VVNRILTRYMGEVMRAIDEGTPVDVADRAMQPLGLPMSPLALMDLVGLGVGLHVADSMHTVFPDRFHASENMRRIVDAGKTSFYVTGEDGSRTLDPEILPMLVQGDAPLTEQEILDRIGVALADEVRRMLDEDVVAEAQDIDLCMIMGAGWPFWLGGITPYLDRSGAAERATGSRFLPRGVASIPA
jgi:3-hydroxyacyl-CoA dehydrogenase